LERAVLAKVAADFGEEPPFEFELVGTHVFFGLPHSETAKLTGWIQDLAAELSLEIYDSQTEKPSAADRKAFKVMQKAQDAAHLGEELQRWQEDAKRGDAVAMNELGNCFAGGEGVRADSTEAFRWYERAAAKGFLPAVINLAECYRTGDGVDPDLAAAARLYEQAYEQDKCLAAFALGEMYRDGEGVPTSIDRAEEYFTVSRANRHPEAYLALKALGRAPED